MNLFLRLLLALSLITCAGGSADAETAKYPEKAPVLSLAIPAGWEAKFENGALKMAAPFNALILVQRVDAIGDEATAREAVPEMAQTAGGQFNLSGMRISTHVREMTGGEFKGFMTDGAGQDKSGREMVWQVFLFCPQIRDYFMVTAIWQKDEEEKMAQDKAALIGSLRAVSGN